MQLSIITPYYNTLEYIKKLRDVLEPQLTDNIEWIIVDDGCNEKELDSFKAKIIHLPTNSGGAGKPRNVGLDNAKGKYIAFIDSDDLVSDDYIQEVLKNLKTDIIFISWKSKVHDIRIEYKPPHWNCAVWCRVYRKKIIGNIRFREDLKIAEDWVFNQQIKYRASRTITKQIYYYTIREDSLVRSNT
jgi:glycosyltransferase involved in cell wall biosynthesis